METFKNYIIRTDDDDSRFDGHFHNEVGGGVTGPPIRVKTDDNRRVHYHKQSDGTDTVEDRSMNRFVYDDDVEASIEALPKSGPHKHMQSDGQHTSEEMFPEREEEPREIEGLSEARENPDDWKKNFITIGNKVFSVVQVIAAENDGWRVEYGYSKGGKVIEDPKQILRSDWHRTFELAEKNAKAMAKLFDVKWKPKPYGDREKFKDVK